MEAKDPSTPGRNGGGDAEDGLALPPGNLRIEKEITMGQELRRSFMEKFGRSTIAKYIPTHQQNGQVAVVLGVNFRQPIVLWNLLWSWAAVVVI
jgi:hypothetical protein